jgi:hypothetical protein
LFTFAPKGLCISYLHIGGPAAHITLTWAFLFSGPTTRWGKRALFCSQNKYYCNSRKTFLCLSLWGEGRQWVTALWSEGQTREDLGVTTEVGPAACQCVLAKIGGILWLFLQASNPWGWLC